MENSTLSFALTGVVPAVCDAEAGERRSSNLTGSRFIDELHACYDYCAAWKEPTQERDRAVVTETQP